MTIDELQQAYDIFLNNLYNKNNLPIWFRRTLKNILSKNITIEEWNTFTQYISNNASDINSNDNFVKALYTFIIGSFSDTLTLNNLTVTGTTNIPTQKR